MRPILLSFLLSCIISFTSHAESIEKYRNYRVLLNTYYLQNKEPSIDKDVVEVSQFIVKNRKNYSGDTVAKAFSLLSDIAFNRGDLVAALQFAQYGNKIEKLRVSIKLDLLLKIARGYYSEGKYIQLIKISSETTQLAERAGNMNYQLQASAYSCLLYTSPSPRD